MPIFITTPNSKSTIHESDETGLMNYIFLGLKPKVYYTIRFNSAYIKNFGNMGSSTPAKNVCSKIDDSTLKIYDQYGDMSKLSIFIECLGKEVKMDMKVSDKVCWQNWVEIESSESS
jgi:hypothetical protein